MDCLGIIRDKRLLAHRLSRFSHERPERLSSIEEALAARGVLDREDIVQYTTRPVRDEELFAVHSELYISQVAAACAGDSPFSYDKDTYLMADSLSVAKLAAGGCLELADAIMAEEIKRGFAIVRPPGHHAEAGGGLGFCIINNVAVTAKYLVDRFDLSRILIFDFDAHHGNGNQEIFYQTDRVLTLSMHQRDIYPFSGPVEQTGSGAGQGYNVNIPTCSLYGDAEYLYLIGQIVVTIVEQLMPQIILVSAGFDGHEADPLSNLALTTKGFTKICETLKRLADEMCDGRLLYVLEGGYDLASLSAATLASVTSLASPDISPPSYPFSKKAETFARAHLLDALSHRWTIM